MLIHWPVEDRLPLVGTKPASGSSVLAAKRANGLCLPQPARRTRAALRCQDPCAGPGGPRNAGRGRARRRSFWARTLRMRVSFFSGDIGISLLLLKRFFFRPTQYFLSTLKLLILPYSFLIRSYSSIASSSTRISTDSAQCEFEPRFFTPEIQYSSPVSSSK